MNPNIPQYRNPPKPPSRRNLFSQQEMLNRFSEKVRSTENENLAKRISSKEIRDFVSEERYRLNLGLKERERVLENDIDFDINDSGDVISEERVRPGMDPTYLQEGITQDKIFSYIYYGISAIGLIGGIIYVIVMKF